MSFLNLLSTQLIDFYDWPRERVEALSVLAGRSHGITGHMVLGMPHVIGRFIKSGKTVVAPDPKLKFNYYHQKAFADFSSGTRDPRENFRELAGFLLGREDKYSLADQQKIKSLTTIVETLLGLDQRYFRDANRFSHVTFTCDNKVLSEGNLNQRAWHMDSCIRIWELNPNSHETPSRNYIWRPNVTTEIIRNEWQYKKGKPVLHPLVAELAVTQYEHDHARPDTRLGATIKIERITDMLREEGHIVRARPYEIVLIDNFTIHRSAMPRKPSLSSFGRLDISPRYQ